MCLKLQKIDIQILKTVLKMEKFIKKTEYNLSLSIKISKVHSFPGSKQF